MARLSIVALFAAACSGSGGQLCVVDARGDAIPQAWAAIDGQRVDADGRGRIRWRGDAPIAAVVAAEGYLPEPVVVTAEPGCMRVGMFEREGAIALHFGGDVMLGRRYVDPPDGEPLLRPGSVGEDARALVESLALGFGAADLSMVNLETVVGDLPLDQAYPAKRWLLQTPPEALDALEAMGVGGVVLANNHLADWQDAGVISTLDALRERGLPSVGGGLDAQTAEAPLVFDVAGVRVGVIAFNSVNGDFVNDTLPTDDEVEPDDIAEPDRWLWERRDWGEPSLGVAQGSRRAGSAWRAYRGRESSLTVAQAAGLWRSARAVYPELQNWGARRGQGGAAVWDPETSPERIRQLRAVADVVVVQFHMGIQFADVPTVAAVRAASLAAEAGADVVVGHHPHVLQGVRWMQGSLVAWSLGNLLFDQDFFSTFDSGYLRVIWRDGIAQARFIPVALDSYRPLPTSGPRAAAILGRVAHRSSMDAVAIRDRDLHARPVAAAPAGALPAFALEHGTLRIRRPAEIPRSWTTIREGGVVALPAGTVGRPRPGSGGPAVELGEALLRVGDFERHGGDPAFDDPSIWAVGSRWAGIVDRHAASGERSLQLVRGPEHGSDVLVRPASRVPIPDAELVFPDTDVPRTPPSLEIEARVRVEGERDLLAVRLVAYAFSDVDPTRAPTSEITGTVELPVPVSRTGRWESVRLDVPPDLLDPPAGPRPNFLLPYLVMRPSRTVTTVAWVDDVELIAWRRPEHLGGGFARIDRVRGVEGELGLELLLEP